MNRALLLQRAAWHEERADEILDRLQAHRFGRRIYLNCDGGEMPNALETERVKLIEAQRALAAIARNAALPASR